MSVFSPAQTLSQSAARRRKLSSTGAAAGEAFWIALEALASHKLRSILTLLGVVIATTTLIAVMSVINGMNLYIADHIANLGANVFVLDQFRWTTSDEDWLKERRRNRPIRIEDYDFLRDNLRGYKNIGAVAWLWPQPNARHESHVIDQISVNAVTPSMIDIGLEQVEYGRYISETDYQHSSAVCFIGQDLVRDLFPNSDPLDKEILLNGLPFRVIGVAKTIGNTFGQSQDNFALIPLSTFHKTYVALPRVNVNVQAWNDHQMYELEDQVRALMRARRHIPYDQDDNFGINGSDTIMALWKQLTGSIFAVTIGIVAVFMVIGGIVIMNIMLASVTERTHEIGIRKSLGARRRDILLQFIFESGVMAAVGGGIGVILAIGVSELVDIFWASSVPLYAVFLGLIVSTAVGLFFGIYPASRASRLDPIEALRTEN
jgi:putative ABC transport system permease protein